MLKVVRMGGKYATIPAPCPTHLSPTSGGVVLPEPDALQVAQYLESARLALVAGRRFRYAARPVDGEGEWMDAEAPARCLDFHDNTIYQMVRYAGSPPCGSLSGYVVRISKLPETIARIKPGELSHLNQYAKNAPLGTNSDHQGRGTPRPPVRAQTSLLRLA